MAIVRSEIYENLKMALATLRSHEALAHNVSPLTWGLREVLQYAEVLLNKDDVDAKADALIDFLKERVIGKEFTDALLKRPYRVQSFADLDTQLQRRNDLIPNLKPEYADLIRRVDLGGAQAAAARRDRGRRRRRPRGVARRDGLRQHQGGDRLQVPVAAKRVAGGHGGCGALLGQRLVALHDGHVPAGRWWVHDVVAAARERLRFEFRARA